MKAFLIGDQDRGECRHVAEELGMSDAALRMAVHHCATGEFLRQEIAAAVVDVEEVDDETRFLLALGPV